MLPETGGSPGSAAKSAAIEATKYCASLNKFMMPGLTQNATNGWSIETTFTFECLNKDDPELKRPHLQPQPNVLIEDARQK